MTRPRNGFSFDKPAAEGNAPWLEEASPRQLSEDARTLEDFAALVRSGPDRLLADPAGLARRRRRVRPALERLLVQGRPWLEVERGLAWPLDLLRELAPILETACGETPPGRDGARDRPETGAQALARARSARLGRAPPPDRPPGHDEEAPPDQTTNWPTPGAPAWQSLLTLALLPFPGHWRRLTRLERLAPRDPDWLAFLAEERARLQAKRRAKPDRRFRLEHFCQVLAGPPPGGKGVLRVFSLPWLFLADGLLESLSRRWLFFVEPPMGLVFRHAWWRRFTTLPEPVLFGVGDPADLAHLRDQAGARPIALCHGDFLIDEPPVPATPRFDLVFNASFDELERKRHRFLLRLLASPPLAGTTALMLGRDRLGRSAEIEREAAALGLADRLTIAPGLRRRDVPARLGQGRLGVHLSLHENGARCVYEFLRADLPVAVSSCTAGLNPALFTAQTGRRVPDGAMAAALADMLTRLGDFSPRRWFLAHSGSVASGALLAAAVGDLVRERGLPDPGPLAALASGGRGRHADPQDFHRLRPHYEHILDRFQAAGARAVHAP